MERKIIRWQFFGLNEKIIHVLKGDKMNWEHMDFNEILQNLIFLLYVLDDDISSHTKGTRTS